MRVPLVDLPSQYAAIRPEVHAAIDRVLARQKFILGEEVEAFERELAAFAGAAYAVGVSSGTDALLLSLMASGISPGDEVVTTAFTFASTVEAIVRLGARPRYVDLEVGGFSPSTRAIADAVGPRTRAVIFVHLYGSCANLQDLAATLGARGVVLVEDSAQAVGANVDGRAAGTFGNFGALSFFPTKTLGAFGDAGAVLAKDATDAARLRSLRNHGQAEKYSVDSVGGNFRLDELQAAVLRVKLSHLPRWLKQRRLHSARLRAELAHLSPDLTLPEIASGEDHAFHQFVVRTSRRDALREHLRTCEIASEVYYPSGMHRQRAWPDEGPLPETDRACLESLAIPVHSELSEQQLEWVIRSVRAFFGS